MRRTARQAFFAQIIALLSIVSPIAAQPSSLAPPIDDAKRLALLLRKLDRTERVLYITAHPDDEDAALISRLVHGEGVEVALLTLTRGNGGQNEIGEELFDAIAVLRSEELAAAHRFDGAIQLYGSQDDFGYSFSVEETFDKWGLDRTIDGIVEVVRRFRPDVILTLPPNGPGGGQHHQASARAAIEAFDRAADLRYRPELGPAHATRRLFQVLWQRAQGQHVCTVELDEVDPVLGCSYAELGARSRSQHKCQGMARVHPPFAARVAKLDWLRAHDEELEPLSHPLESLEPSGLGKGDLGASNAMELLRLAIAARNEYTSGDPAGILNELVAILAFARTLPKGVRRDTLERRAMDALITSFGFSAAARGSRPFVAPGETFEVTIGLRSGSRHPIAVSWQLVGPGVSKSEHSGECVVEPRSRAVESVDVTVPLDAAPTIPAPPFAPGTVALNAYHLEVVIRSGSLRLPLRPVAIEAQWVDAEFPSVRATDVRVVPDPSVRPVRDVVVAPFTSGEPSAMAEFYVSTTTPAVVEVRFETGDSGWTAEPATLSVDCPGRSQEVRVRTRVHGPGPGRVELQAIASRHGSPERESRDGYRVIDYPHIRRTALLEPGRVSVVSFACNVDRRARVGYVSGTGDRIPEAISALDVECRALTAHDLLEEDLDRFDTIVLGVRAYKVREDLIAAQSRLVRWMTRGGHLVVQYNKFEFNTATEPARSAYVPYPGAVVSSKRVTVEESPVRVNEPEHRFFTAPNVLAPTDWSGWVQERGLYFLDARDPRYRQLLTLEDPWPFNPGPKTGALVTTEVGEGRWTYVGLGLFRQLPAGVPGAYRLLANLIATE